MQRDVTIAPLQGKSYLSLPLDGLLKGVDAKNVVLLCELMVDGKAVSVNEHFFKPYKELAMPRAQIGADVARTRDGFRITLASDKFARAVYLSLAERDGLFSDNYFDLFPGKKVDVEFHTRAPMALAEFRNQLKIRSMVDAFKD